MEADAARVQATAGSAIGATAFGPGAQTGASGMGGFGEGLASTLMATNVQAQGQAASAGAGAGVNVAIQSDSSSASVQSLVGYVDGFTAFGNGLVTAEALNVETPLPSGTNLYARGEKALGASAVGAYVRMQSGTDDNRVEVRKGSMTGLAAEGGYVSAGSMSEDGTPSGKTLVASGIKSSAASGVTAGLLIDDNIALESGKVTVSGSGSVVGMVSEGGMVGADSLGFNGLLGPSGTVLKASGTKSSAASAIGASAILESGKISVTAGSVVGGISENGQVGANGLGFNGLFPAGTVVTASGTKSSAASAIGASAILESGKISVTGGSVVGMVSEGGQVEANSLGFGSGNPSGSVLIASGRESTLGSSSGVSITMESDRISTLAGSLVGASASNSNGGAEVWGTTLSAGSAGASGSILTAYNADNAIIAAISGATADLKPTSAEMTAGTLIGVGAISLGATGDLHTDSLTASYTGSSAASGSGLKSMAGTSAIMGASGTLTFKPSASNGINSGALFAEAGGKTTTPGNSLSSSALQSSYTAAATPNRNVAGSITASGTTGSNFVFAGYTADITKRTRSSSGTYDVSSYYNTIIAIPPVSKGASITP